MEFKFSNTTCQCLRKAACQVQNQEQTQEVRLPEGMPDKQLAEVLFPVRTAKPEYKMPDYEYVAREMQRSGVTLNLLWLEYCEQCSNNSESRIS